jgi:hypothetical protein
MGDCPLARRGKPIVRSPLSRFGGSVGISLWEYRRVVP